MRGPGGAGPLGQVYLLRRLRRGRPGSARLVYRHEEGEQALGGRPLRPAGGAGSFNPDPPVVLGQGGPARPVAGVLRQQPDRLRRGEEPPSRPAADGPAEQLALVHPRRRGLPLAFRTPQKTVGLRAAADPFRRGAGPVHLRQRPHLSLLRPDSGGVQRPGLDSYFAVPPMGVPQSVPGSRPPVGCSAVRAFAGRQHLYRIQKEPQRVPDGL